MADLDHWIPKYKGSIPEPPMDMPDLVWQLMYHRGFTTEDAIQEFLAPQMRGLSDPFSLLGMEPAVERLIQAFSSKQKICIYADFDLDGTPGCALLISGLTGLGFEKPDYYQPRRLSEGYGIHKHAIDNIVEKGCDLLLTVDVGITDVESIAYANSKNLDVIVTDHHLAKEELPPALSIINPNQPNDVSGLGHLCGTGVAFYLILALRRRLKEKGLLNSNFDPKTLLDCFAIGTLTDMVPLIKENRLLVKHGLEVLRSTDRVGLRALLESMNLYGKKLTEYEVSFRISPRLNSLSRMDEDILPIDLFLETDRQKAEELVSQIQFINDKRKNLQVYATNTADKLVKPELGFNWVFAKDFHQGIIGLVATKLTQKFDVPSFIGTLKDDGTITGSARTPKSYNLIEILETQSDLLEKFGGHAQAAGFEIKLENAEAFSQGLTEYFSNKKTQESFNKLSYYEVEGDLTEYNESLLKWLEKMGPFGIECEKPVFKVNKAIVAQKFLLKDKHIKFKLSHSQLRQPVEAIMFSASQEMLDKYAQLEVGDKINLLADPQWNEFRGAKTLQLRIDDFLI